MISDRIIISMTVLALSVSFIATGVPVYSAGAPQSAVAAAPGDDIAMTANASTAMAAESSNSLYAYQTEAVTQLSTIRIDGTDYTLPLTMEQLTADGWEATAAAKEAVGQPFVIKRENKQLSVQPDAQGRILRIVELYTAPGGLEIPGKIDIKIGISEGELEYILNQLPVTWESTHDKSGTTRYRLTVPLGETTKTTAEQAPSESPSDTGSNSLIFPACEYVITVSTQQVKAIEIRLLSAPGLGGWSNEVLGYRAAAYYGRQTNEFPPLFRIEEQPDGSVLVRLFEDLEDHIATWAIYRIDRTGKGYDATYDPGETTLIDFMN